MNDTILFQHVFSDSPCAEMLALTTPLTLRYCQTHHIDYQCIVGTFDLDKGHWDVPILIHAFIEAGYSNIVYLDADTVIVNSAVALRDAIVTDKIGAVWHELGTHSHYNAGALYVSNTPRTRNFVDQWLAKKPGDGFDHFPLTWEQGIFNVLGKKMEIIHRLDNRWNAENGVSPSDEPVVKGFHGYPNQLEAIRDAVAECGAKL